METNETKNIWAKTRRTLLARLRGTNVDEASWYDFFDTYSRLIYSVARKSGLNHADAEDILQATVLKVSQYIDRFEIDPGRGRFRNWVCLITKQQIANHYRKAKHLPPIEEPEPSAEDDLPEIEDPVNEWGKIWDAEFFGHANEMALARVKQKVSPKQYQIFHLYCIKQRDVQQIAAMLDVTANEIYLAKNRVLPFYEDAAREIFATADNLQAA